MWGRPRSRRCGLWRGCRSGGATEKPLAALYDIHGNLPALEAVLADVRAARVDDVVIGGDVVPGPMPGECLGLLRALDLPTLFVRGNGDRSILEARRGEPLAYGRRLSGA